MNYNELFKELGDIYSLSYDEVENIFYEILKQHFESENILLEKDGLYIDGIKYEYFDKNEINKFRHVLDEELNKYSIEKYKVLFKSYLNRRVVKGVLFKEGKKKYFFKLVVDNQVKNNLILLVSKENVRFKNFDEVKGRVFDLYVSKKPKIFKINKPIYFNKIFTNAKLITYKSVYKILENTVVKAFNTIYSIEDFKVKYISPIKKEYGFINLYIRKDISANLLDYLDNVFGYFGYKVSVKKKGR